LPPDGLMLKDAAMHPTFERNKLILITALITMFITSLVWVGIGAAGYWLVTRESPPFAVELGHPNLVQTGETFTLNVKVTNEGADDLKFAELDLYDTFLDGFEVIAIRPKPKTKERVFGIVTYSFSRKLKPAESTAIEIELRAKETGIWAGGVDVCTPTMNYVTQYAEIEVVAP